MTPTGIEPATSRLFAQYLNQLRHSLSPTSKHLPEHPVTHIRTIYLVGNKPEIRRGNMLRPGVRFH
jgi:hypothetical protein